MIGLFFFFFLLGPLENVPCLCMSDSFPQVDFKSSTVSKRSAGVHVYLLIHRRLQLIYQQLFLYPACKCPSLTNTLNIYNFKLLKREIRWLTLTFSEIS